MRKLLLAFLIVMVGSVLAFLIPHAPGKPDGVTKLQADIKPVSSIAPVSGHFDTLAIVPITPQQYVQMEASKYGWDTGSQWEALQTLINNESGWRAGVVNSIGACGLFQSLPCSKLGAPLDNVANQATWGLNYISKNYQTPANALATWHSRCGSPQGCWY